MTSVINIENIEKTLVVMKNIMHDDKIDVQKQNSISKINKIVLSSDKFLLNASNDIEYLMKDGKITIQDLPRMISLLLKSQTFLLNLKNSVSNIEFNSIPMNLIMKYSSFSLFYYLMLNDNTNQEDLDSFLLLFPSLWSLVELSLPNHENKKVKAVCC
jgi:hypothetical protein